MRTTCKSRHLKILNAGLSWSLDYKVPIILLNRPQSVDKIRHPAFLATVWQCAPFFEQYRICRNKRTPRNKRPPQNKHSLKTVLFQRGEYTKPMAFDGWFFKGGSTQNRWALMGDFFKEGSTQNRWVLEFCFCFWKLSTRGVYMVST